MGLQGVSCEKGRVTREECLQCVRDPQHPCHIPQPMIVKFWHGLATKPHAGAATPSRVLSCARKPFLMEQEDYWLDIHNEYASMRGEVIHAGLESFSWGDNCVVLTEKRLQTLVDTKYGTQPFTAQSDAIVVVNPNDSGDKVLVDVWDWKTTEFGHELVAADRKHIMQAWMYAWMVARNLPMMENITHQRGVQVRSVNICYISSSKSRIFTSLGPGTARGKRITGTKPQQYEELQLAQLPTLTMQQVEQFVRGRLEQRVEQRRALPVLPPVLEGDAAKWCFRCPVVGACMARRAAEANAGEEDAA